MKRIIFYLSLLTLLLAGCQDNKNGTLETSNLEKMESKGNVTEEQANTIPITYKASTVKSGLEALPFEMKLPEKLPFDANPFQPPTIDDFNHDGKILKVEFRTFSKNQEEKIILMIVANYPVINSQEPNFKEIKLKNGVIGKYLGKTLTFQLNNVSFDVVYVNENIPLEQHQKEIIEIANQML